MSANINVERATERLREALRSGEGLQGARAEAAYILSGAPVGMWTELEALADEAVDRGRRLCRPGAHLDDCMYRCGIER